ncbi:MAG: hypothetical protein FWD57_13570, partial [Polyangiaceae bacterium]|nr:hypothetical protein [Polyangiaceae bacterium]
SIHNAVERAQASSRDERACRGNAILMILEIANHHGVGVSLEQGMELLDKLVCACVGGICERSSEPIFTLDCRPGFLDRIVPLLMPGISGLTPQPWSFPFTHKGPHFSAMLTEAVGWAAHVHFLSNPSKPK